LGKEENSISIVKAYFRKKTKSNTLMKKDARMNFCYWRKSSINKYKLPSPTFRKQKEEIKVKMAVEYAIRNLNLTVYSDDITNKEVEWLGFKVFSRYFDAIKLAPKVKLRTGDTLHVAYAYQLKREGKIEYIVSLDEDFQKKKNLIENETGIKLLSSNL
jgi:hypothetical protein